MAATPWATGPQLQSELLSFVRDLALEPESPGSMCVVGPGLRPCVFPVAEHTLMF